jgi:hypothetical protein
LAFLSRREFWIGVGVSTAAIATAKVGPQAPSDRIPDVASVDRPRVLRAAEKYLHEPPITITAYRSSRSPGGVHDYFSEGDYWWPNPKDPSGPYIRRDGMSNSNNFTAHRHALIRLSMQVPALAAAWKLTRDKRYAAHATLHLSAWFLDTATLMEPNLQFAQAIHGVTTGRGTGIIDTVQLVEVARAIPVIEESGELSTRESDSLRSWFSKYLNWMTTSKNGQEERDAKNNHGTCWVVQVAAFAALTRNEELTTFCRDRFKNVLVPDQIAANGSFPLELARTKPYGYCLFDLDALATACQILSTGEDNLFAYQLSNGRGFAKAMAFMFPYIANKSSWPYPHDVEYWEAWPVRQPSLLFAGMALDRPEYFPVWRRLNPDPSVEEIIRNYPIRQPVLWV